MVNGVVGEKLIGGADRCRKCGSVVKTLFVVCFVPVLPRGKYRVKYITPTRYYSRKLGTHYEYRDAQALLDIAATLEDVDKQRAFAAYREIAELFPNTPAGREADRNAHCLRAAKDNST